MLLYRVKAPGNTAKCATSAAELMPHLLITRIFVSRNGPLEEGRMSDSIGCFIWKILLEIPTVHSADFI